MTKKIYLIGFLLIFLIVIVSSQSFTFELDEEVNFRFRCFDENNNYCPSSVACQISVEAPNGTNILNNQSMTFNTTFFNVTLPTEELGTYSSIIICQSTNSSTSEFTYLVTTSGNPPLNEGEGFTLFSIIIILIVTTIFLLIATIYIKNQAFKIFLGSLSLLMLISTIGFGVTVMQQLFGAFTNLVSGYSLFFRLFVILLTAGGIGLIVFLVVFALKAFNRSRGLID